MEVEIYHDVDGLGPVIQLATRSTAICGSFHKPELTLKFVPWGGQLEDLPRDHPVLVDAFIIERMGSEAPCDLKQLVEMAAGSGHLLFLRNMILHKGRISVSQQDIEEDAQDFLTRVRAHQAAR